MSSHLAQCPSARAAMPPTVMQTPFGSTQSVQYRRVVRVEKRTVDQQNVRSVPVNERVQPVQVDPPLLSFDNPGQSPRIPVFSGTTDLPAAFGICGQHRHREDAIVWKYRTANKLATVRWGLTKEKINGAVAHFEEKGLSEMPFVENRYKELQDSKGEETARAFLTGYTADFAGATILRWQEMADEFWKMFARGF